MAVSSLVSLVKDMLFVGPAWFQAFVVHSGVVMAANDLCLMLNGPAWSQRALLDRYLICPFRCSGDVLEVGHVQCVIDW